MSSVIRSTIMRTAATAAALTLCAPAARAQFGVVNPPPGPQGTFAITNVHIFPVSAPEIARGTVVISGGKITAVGANVSVPSGAKVIDATGLNVYPGMIDAASTVAVADIGTGVPQTMDNAEVGSFNPNAQAYYGYNPHSAVIAITRVVGITAVVSRTSGGVVSGQATLMNLAGTDRPSMSLVKNVAMVITLPGSGGRGRGFGRRGGGNNANPAQQLDSLDALIANTHAYMKAWDAYNADHALPRPNHDVVLESMEAMVTGQQPVMFNADNEAAIRKAVAFADSNHLKAIIVGGHESDKVADLLKSHDVPVILTGVRALPETDEPYDQNFTLPEKLAADGVSFAISSGESSPGTRELPAVAGVAAAFGLSHADAIKSVTLWPAQILGVGTTLGSLDVGKVANLVVTTGDLLEPRTDTKYLFIDGRQVPLETKHTDLYNAFKDRKE